MVSDALRGWAARFADMEKHVDALCEAARDAAVVLELGVRTGVSTWALLEGLPPDGRLISMDIQDCYDACHERVRGDRRWEFVRADDRDLAITSTLPQADLVFIDTSHEFGHTLTELYLAAHLKARRILLHDYLSEEGVRRAVSIFLLERPQYRLARVDPSIWGLAVLELEA